MTEHWCVAVFKCKPDDIMKVLPNFYNFVKDLEGVKSLHFLIRDRVNDEVVFSFRVMTEDRRIVASKMAYKLAMLLPKGNFAVDPEVRHKLWKYVAWSSGDRIAKCGPKKFVEFYNLLERMSRLVVQMIKSRYFSSDERVEIAHVMSWMLGCAEYGLMSPQHWEIGYYDRIEDRSHPYLKQHFVQERAE